MIDQIRNRKKDDEEKKIKDILPWADSNFLGNAIAEKKRERNEALEMVENSLTRTFSPTKLSPS